MRLLNESWFRSAGAAPKPVEFESCLMDRGEDFPAIGGDDLETLNWEGRAGCC